MKDIFRIDWLPHRWLHKTSMLEPVVRGIYIQIVCLIYCNEGAIENNPKWISGVCNCSPRLVKSAIDTLVSGDWLEFQGDKLTQKRAERVLSETRTRIEHSSNGGRTKAENQRKNNINKEIVSSGVENSLRANNNNNNNNNIDYSLFYPPEKAKEIYMEGKVIKLNYQDYYRWWKEIIPQIANEDDFYEILNERDDWLDKQPIAAQKKWFMTTPRDLANKAKGI